MIEIKVILATLAMAYTMRAVAGRILFAVARLSARMTD
jgi:hypothetical protein